MNAAITTSTVIQRHTAHFPGHPAALTEVRAFVASQLQHHPRAADVVLAASEYATNAVLYSRAGQGPGFDVLLEIAPDSTVRLEVHDPGSAMPSHTDSRPVEERGRGIDIVTTLAHTSGHDDLHGGRRAGGIS
ncbi:ATP-binding protein [Actinomadura viridis]|uniref:ATP-binding protein n=1 Tax=Actinomadura viridis TaxID=58110 RepID=UPI0036AAD61D